MVDLKLIQSSNSRIASTLPAALTAVFVGATSGIGRYTLTEFVSKVPQPRVYFVRRSQDAADEITAECERLNPKADLTFIKSDVGLIKNVDTVCRQITAHEDSIDLLVLSQGSFAFDKTTAEGLTVASSLIWHSRFRFIHNLLPHLQRGKALKRVVSILAGTKEGRIFEDNLPGKDLPISDVRGHAVGIHTLVLEKLAATAPDLSFVHSYPGPVSSGIHREIPRSLMSTLFTSVMWVMGLFRNIPNAESGARHVFEATSAAFPPKESAGSASMVPLEGSIGISRGTNGKEGSGVYDVDESCEGGDAASEKLLAGYRERGLDKILFDWIKADWKRIVGA